MPLEPSETKTFEIREVGDIIRSPKGHTSIECETDLGTVAFWGDKSLANLRALQKRQPPFFVRCGCSHPLPNFPTHAWWVPETSHLEFVQRKETREARRPANVEEDYTEAPPVKMPSGAGSPFRTIAAAPAAAAAPAPAPAPAPFPPREESPLDDRALYIVGVTQATIWDDDTDHAGGFVSASYAFRGRAVKEWLTSKQKAEAAHWLFLSPRYGLIEPDHPVGRHDATFSDKAGALSDDALREQVEHQRRWSDNHALRDFEIVYVWAESTTIEEKIHTAFERAGAKVVRLKALTKAK